MSKIIILHNKIQNNTEDEIDVLAQRDLVQAVCQKLGHEVSSASVGDDIYTDLKKIQSQSPDIIFNLVESGWGKGELLYVAPALLNALKIPYTGVPLDALFLTTNKVLAKKMMRLHHIPTADFYAIGEINRLTPEKTYIVKPIWEEASVGIDTDSVFTLKETSKVEKLKKLSSSHYFIEEYIEGREFNISLLATENGHEVLPPAEMIFSSYFDDKPKVVGYKAKWDETSEEYKQTNRRFGTLDDNGLLKNMILQSCDLCWNSFNLHGYVRVDLRVDDNNQPYILEINGNPCISNDSGFVAALNEAGYHHEYMIKQILKDLN
ncbi:MAG: ATP-grasp domain-containing protein [Candidatus Marinimicrobia bacterium]|nr:ATP-grasp domain-containing protein [Candidatus Neomarinimicrobiota bacterium]